MEVVAQRARHCHGASLEGVMELSVASLVSNLPPSIGFEFTNHLSHLHSTQWSGNERSVPEKQLLNLRLLIARRRHRDAWLALQPP